MIEVTARDRNKKMVSRIEEKYLFSFIDHGSQYQHNENIWNGFYIRSRYRYVKNKTSVTPNQGQLVRGHALYHHCYSFSIVTAHALYSAVSVAGSKAGLVSQLAQVSRKWNAIHTMPGGDLFGNVCFNFYRTPARADLDFLIMIDAESLSIIERDVRRFFRQ